MKLNQIPNFRVEDYPSEQSWINRLFINLNPFISSVNQLSDQNVDFSTNIKSVTKEYTITSFQEFSFTWPFTSGTPVDLRVIQALKGSTQTPTILMAAWEYDKDSRLITVLRMVELSESSVSELSGTFKFTIRVTV